MPTFDPTYELALKSDRSSRDVAAEFAVNKTTVNTHRKQLGISRTTKNQHSPATQESARSSDEPVETFGDSDGSFGSRWIRSRALTADDADQWIRSTGRDPDDYHISFSTNAYGDGLWSNKLSARPKDKSQVSKMPPADELLKIIDDWDPSVPEPWFSVEDGTFVVCAADFQIGKTDYGTGTEHTIERVLVSFSYAADYAAKHRFKEIVLTDLGDILENIFNTSTQRATNDRALTEQIRIARRLMLEAVKMLAPLTEKLTYLAIPSNHGSVRIGFKADENHALDDYGIEIAMQIKDVCDNSEKLSNVQVIIPETSMESLSYETQDGTVLGLVHGHQANNSNSLSKWWAGQDHGRMPTANADILLVGHYHSLRVEQSGNSRWIFVCPASEAGSSWFANKTGQRSQSGILTFVADSGSWSELKVL